MSTKAFLVDVDKCTGCKLCVVACKDEHVDNAYPPWTRPQPETGHFWVDIVALERGRQPRVRMSYLPLFCQHCADAPCIKSCAEGAIKTRADGLVWIDPATCTGCGKCACPYGVIYMNSDLGIAQKCTGCAHRVDQGALPRCVDVCPHEAIVIGDTGAFAAGDAERPLEAYLPEHRAAPRVLWKGLPRPWIAGTVIDAGSDEVLTGVAVRVIDLADAGTVTVHTDAFGDFWVRELRKDERYRVEIRADGYEDVLEVVITDGDRDLGTVRLERRA
jgi:Fe-S-cluster-containing dehydrogenase component